MTLVSIPQSLWVQLQNNFSREKHGLHQKAMTMAQAMAYRQAATTRSMHFATLTLQVTSGGGGTGKFWSIDLRALHKHSFCGSHAPCESYWMKAHSHSIKIVWMNVLRAPLHVKWCAQCTHRAQRALRVYSWDSLHGKCKFMFQLRRDSLALAPCAAQCPHSRSFSMFGLEGGRNRNIQDHRNEPDIGPNQLVSAKE